MARHRTSSTSPSRPFVVDDSPFPVRVCVRVCDHRLCNACGLHYYKILRREKKLRASYPEPRLRLPVHALLND